MFRRLAWLWVISPVFSIGCASIAKPEIRDVRVTVSAIDLTLILQTLDSILGKISVAVRFMALFTVLTGCWFWGAPF